MHEHRNSIARAIPIFMAPDITDIVADAETLEVEYREGIVRNPATGASVELRKFPPLIEQIFATGGLPEFTYERYLREAGSQST